jgi:predicted phosphoadenosine phosphosulfate sulfurtransferase
VPKHYLGMDVLTAARKRIEFVFDHFERIYISFSGGKDSTVMTHLVMDEAVKRNRRVGLFFLDWECQFTLTIDHIRSMFELYAKHIEPYWVALPIRTWNGCSQHETEWVAWDEAKRDLWVREKDPLSISDKTHLPFYFQNMMFEEFTPLFAKWYSQGERCACFIGIRTQESLNRYRTMAREKPMFNGKPWTTNVVDDVWNAYPIYDWEVEDDWTYVAKHNKPYNKLYDRMHQAGLTVNQMRIDEPFGDTQRIGLWLYQIIEPKMWAKMSLRVAGANMAALYSNERGNVMGLNHVTLPKGHTWESFAKHILNTMPPPTSEHYKNKLAKYIQWYRTRGYPNGIPDEVDQDLESKGKAPSWRRLCKALLRNDFWCKTIGFSPTKSKAYSRYMDMMRKKRSEWSLFAE